MTVAYIGLGSNLGDSKRTLVAAWKMIGEIKHVSLVKLSDPYRTAPVGMTSDNWFVNSVGSVATELQPAALLDQLFLIEDHFGRIRPRGKGGYSDRTLDLDLLLWGDVQSSDKKITLPHPEIQNRLFVLVPLVEIAPQNIHPVSGKTSELLLAELQTRISGQKIIRSTW